MKRSVRGVLAESHIAAVAIAVLLIGAIATGVVALWEPITRLAEFTVTAIAIHDMPSISPGLSFEDRAMLLFSSAKALNALLCLAGAWILSRWVYGVGPLRSLSTYRDVIVRRSHVG